jgi:hypothetical protein
MQEDLKPERWTVYGYCVMQKSASSEEWTTQLSDEYSNLPAHEPFLEVAKDRVSYFREHGIDARVVALLQDKEYDTPERMDNAKIEGGSDEEEDNG